MQSVLWAGVPKLRVRHTHPSVGVGSSRVSHNKSYLIISPASILVQNKVVSASAMHTVVVALKLYPKRL